MGVVSSSFDGVPVAFEVAGSGPLTIVFVHGLEGDHTDFDSQMTFFSQTHQVLGIDLPGAGGSGRDRSSWTMEAFGEDVATVVDHLGLEEVVLVGHSLGGDVTVEAALRLSGRVRGLVWAASFRSLDSFMNPEQMAAWFEPFNVDFVAAMDDLNRRNLGPNADPALVDALTAKGRSADQTRTMGLLRSKFEHAPAVAEALTRIDVPAFAVNPGLKPSDEASFARHGVELRIIPGVSHFIMLEDPESFNAELTKILTQLDG